MVRLPSGWASRWLALVLVCASLSARAADSTEVDELKRELRALQQRFEEAEAQHRRELEALNRRLEELTRKQAAETTRKELENELAKELAEAGPTNHPAAPVPGIDRPKTRSTAWADVGLAGTFAAGTSTADDIEGGTQLGGHDPNQRGFTVQGVELTFSGAVDPYFRGNANILFQVDSDGETLAELEEAWLETFHLPGQLQLRAGQLLTDFGRHNPTHPHAWAFVDVPVVLGRFMGPDGLRNPGARLSWLAPTPFYSELFLSVQDSHGSTAAGFRSSGDAHGHGDESGLPFAYRHRDNERGVEGVEDLLFTPRYAASLDLTDTQVLLVGASASFGPNSSGQSGDTTTEIYGVDLTWKWKSARHHGGFPFVTFQTEGLLRRYQAGRFDWDENGDGTLDPGEVEDLGTGLPAVLGEETLVDYGFYSQVLYGFHKGWAAGLRFDYADSDPADYERAGLALDGAPLGRDPQRAERWRLSPNLTWYPSEFSKIRLQYNYDDRGGIGEDHSVWLQFELILGAHAAHAF